ncbi:hypothetical protein GOODEAATRI_002653, partial [Goodea atripinnis]
LIVLHVSDQQDLRMSRWGERLKKVEQLAQSFQQNPLTTPYKPRLWPCQPSSVWRLFPRQSLAISFAQSCKEVGKNAAFTVAQDNQFAAKPAKGMSVEESVFLASLVCNVRIVVDLKEEVWYQKCHDPDCRNFRSSSML